MSQAPQTPSHPPAPFSAMDLGWPELAWRVAWVALRLLLVGALASQGTYFFYQGF
jgi:hypothetical protein